MSLPDVAALKRYLKIENTAEDTLLAELLARSLATAQRRVGVPIVSVSRVFVDEAETGNFYSHGPRSLLVPVTPFDVDTLVVVDADGVTVDADDLRSDVGAGIIRYVDGSPFENGPYTITVDVGLDNEDDYDTLIEPIVSQAIVDLVADLYQRRNPAASSERNAGGDSVAYTADGIPCRVADALDSIRRAP